MDRYYPYNPNSQTRIREVHMIKDGKVQLRHIPKKSSGPDAIFIDDGWLETDTAPPEPGRFFCNYSTDTFYRDANRTLIFNAADEGRPVRVAYTAVGTPLTAEDANEIRTHIENDIDHARAGLRIIGEIYDWEAFLNLNSSPVATKISMEQFRWDQVWDEERGEFVEGYYKPRNPIGRFYRVKFEPVYNPKSYAMYSRFSRDGDTPDGSPVYFAQRGDAFWLRPPDSTQSDLVIFWGAYDPLKKFWYRLQSSQEHPVYKVVGQIGGSWNRASDIEALNLEEYFMTKFGRSPRRGDIVWFTNTQYEQVYLYYTGDDSDAPRLHSNSWESFSWYEGGSDTWAYNQRGWIEIGWSWEEFAQILSVEDRQLLERLKAKDGGTPDVYGNYQFAIFERLADIEARLALPTASETVKGGVKVGSGLAMDGETLNCTANSFQIFGKIHNVIRNYLIAGTELGTVGRYRTDLGEKDTSWFCNLELWQDFPDDHWLHLSGAYYPWRYIPHPGDAFLCENGDLMICTSYSEKASKFSEDPDGLGGTATWSIIPAQNPKYVGKGSAFPSSPAKDDLFYKTDVGLYYRFDGSSWLAF